MRLRTLVLIAALSFPAVSKAQPSISGVVHGSPGDWFLHFTVTNSYTAPVDHWVYFFGVFLATGEDVVSSGGSFGHFTNDWTNAANGGSSIVYNNNWFSQFSGILPGAQLGGFVARSTSVTAPTTVAWFAYSAGNVAYNGPGAFSNNPFNPGFEGVATLEHVNTVPEPATIALLATGLAAVTGAARRRRKH